MATVSANSFGLVSSEVGSAAAREGRCPKLPMPCSAPKISEVKRTVRLFTIPPLGFLVLQKHKGKHRPTCWGAWCHLECLVCHLECLHLECQVWKLGSFGRNWRFFFWGIIYGGCSLHVLSSSFKEHFLVRKSRFPLEVSLTSGGSDVLSRCRSFE